MAIVEKFSRSAIANLLEDVERTIQNPTNPDIDRSKSNLNYSLIDHGMSSYDYYKERLSQCYLYNRDDVKTCFGWVITCPEDVLEDTEDLFFYNCFDFLNKRYGRENCIQAVVHKDESCRSHLHYLSIPVVPDPKHSQGIKVCCDKVINRKDLRNFHPDLDRFLRDRGQPCGVYTGITKRQGGNRTVEELKQEREKKHTRQVEIEQKRTARCAYCFPHIHKDFSLPGKCKVEYHCVHDGLEDDKVQVTNEEKCSNCPHYKSKYIEYPLTIDGINNKEVKASGFGHEVGCLCEIRPCGNEYEGKTYIGFYLGDLPIAITSSYNRNTGHLENSTMNNPAIFVPELKKIVYGCESWWREIESPNDFKDISDDDIENTWYVKLLKSFH